VAVAVRAREPLFFDPKPFAPRDGNLPRCRRARRFDRTVEIPEAALGPTEQERSLDVADDLEDGVG